MTLVLIMTCFIFKAQAVSLDIISQCEKANCPDLTSVKDTNNLLNKFIGVWKGNYSDGRTYEIQFIKN
jgi:hypothetical protein